MINNLSQTKTIASVFLMSTCFWVMPIMNPLFPELGLSLRANPQDVDFSKLLKSHPKAKDWRYFLAQNEGFVNQLIAREKQSGRFLKDWAWGWRMAFIRKCSQSNQPVCREILVKALFDKALVVRAEAATYLGLRFDGTQDKTVTALLTKALDQKENYRNGKPMFIQQRILFAIHKIGGIDQSSFSKKHLNGKRDLSLNKYWKKLTRVHP